MDKKTMIEIIFAGLMPRSFFHLKQKQSVEYIDICH